MALVRGLHGVAKAWDQGREANGEPGRSWGWQSPLRIPWLISLFRYFLVRLEEI